MGLLDSSQPITIVIVGVMMAIRWLEAHVKENNRQAAPTKKQLQELDCLKDLDLFETMCKNQKERKLEEFRNFRISKRQTKKETQKLRKRRC